eukprot:CAMPEP_0206174652 /NCGR_PEP_ID=MMETSP1474-20131121/52699_1 /ASSEMBLY_ACC=CAM_ASM_001110 /TAXON_ID=97495 /ORGANISM="Imantonia sp., Strain RCC918" /LENGTH=297 /DNA_ID=CAMNT_0053584359 /DNA_START=89 /DNA_END=979 /DNA_ORIENTATION=-
MQPWPWTESGPGLRPSATHLPATQCAPSVRTRMPNTCACGCGLRVSFKGVYRKDHQPAGTSRDPEGKSKERNDHHNQIWGPISSAKVQERARLENEARIANMAKSEGILSESDAATLAEEISTTATGALLHGRTVTIEELVGIVHHEDGNPHKTNYNCIYFGYTARHILDEYLRFLTARGALRLDDNGDIINGHDSRNRPVLLWANGDTITMKQAEQQLGFRYIEIYASTLKLNARRVESALQQRFQYMPLGPRLWRGPDKGAKYDTPEDAHKVHKVFVTFSTRVAQMLRERAAKLD